MAKKMMDKLKSKIGIAQKDAKNAPASAPGKTRQIVGETCAESAGAVESTEKKNPAAEPQKLIGWLPEIYDDTDVCRVVGWRRKELDKYREPWTFGTEWDWIGMHVGMTGLWLRQIKGIRMSEWPRWAEANGLKRIEREDEIVTVRMKRRHPNMQAVTVVVLRTGEEKICRVRNSGKLMIGEVFDCRMERGKLYMVESLNTERW